MPLARLLSSQEPILLPVEALQTETLGNDSLQVIVIYTSNVPSMRWVTHSSSTAYPLQ
jgi:hypothetical protein